MINFLVRNIRNHPYFSALVGYCLIILVLFHKIIFGINQVLPGINDNIALGKSVWHYWFLKQIIFFRQSLTSTDLVFYPEKINLILDSNEFVNALLTLPLQPFGLIVATNVLILLSLLVTAWGMFLLVRYLTNNFLSGILAGIVFTFAPVAMTHLSHGSLNIALIWAIPFHFYFLIRGLKQQRVLFGVLAGLFLAIVGYNYLVHFTVFLPLSLLISTYYLITNRKSGFKSRFFGLVATYVGALLLLAPLLIQILQVRQAIPLEVPLSSQLFWSPQVEYFFLPTLRSLLFGGLFPDTAIDSEFAIYVGWSLVLALVSGVVLQFWKKYRDREVVIWGLLAIFFFVLSLGPLLPFKTNSTYRIGDLVTTQIPSLFILYQKIPFIGGIQEPVRFVYPLMFALAVFSGLLIAKLWSSKNLKLQIGTGILIVGVVVDFLIIKIPTFRFEVPEVYAQIAQDDASRVVMDVPIGRVTGTGAVGYFQIDEYSYYQTIHGKKVTNGFVARTPGWHVTNLQKAPFDYFLHMQKHGCDKQVSRETIVSKQLNELGVDYIVIHKDKLVDLADKRDETLDCISEDLDYSVIQDDYRVRVYKRP